MKVLATIKEKSLLELVTASFLWLREGLGIFLPGQIRAWRWRPFRKVLLLDKDLNITDTRFEERSLFGSVRITDTIKGKTMNLPLFIGLPHDLVHLTSISLPRVSQNDLNAAVRLRLKSISPLPVEQAAFAVGTPGQEGDDRICVPVLLTRKTTLEECRSAYNQAPQQPIIGHVSSEGRQFSFQSPMAGTTLADHKGWLKYAGAVASVLLALWGIAHFADRQTTALRSYQQALTSELRTMRDVNASLSGTLNSLVTENILSSADLNSALASAENTIPSDGLIETIAYRQGGIYLSGYLPETSDNATQGRAFAWQVRGNARPGYVGFSQVLPVEDLQ